MLKNKLWKKIKKIWKMMRRRNMKKKILDNSPHYNKILEINKTILFL